jgi:hypothetical protein
MMSKTMLILTLLGREEEEGEGEEGEEDDEEEEEIEHQRPQLRHA